MPNDSCAFVSAEHNISFKHPSQASDFIPNAQRCSISRKDGNRCLMELNEFVIITALIHLNVDRFISHSQLSKESLSMCEYSFSYSKQLAITTSSPTEVSQAINSAYFSLSLRFQFSFLTWYGSPDTCYGPI